jgi:hypothetical protein
MILRYGITIGLMLLLSGCASERHFAADTLWPFGNPNAPPATSETAERALGQQTDVTPIAPQAGDVWPGAVKPMPTLSEIQSNANTPLGQDYTPSLPSPYPPGQNPDPGSSDSVPVTSGPLYSVQPGAVPVVVPAVPGDAR